MANKKSFVLRIDEETYEALEKWAADEFRSVNGQLEWIITRALREAGRLPQRQPPPQPSQEAPPEIPVQP
ncbi:MAG: Arc family DNA-binding protein [Saprospiraceae bacterium]|nr:Arc family DNA-binding protein [Saprospiraceae bacterium]MDW8230729.1 Arc family DNA-binding protein [Saprospiraceae bacterium]